MENKIILDVALILFSGLAFGRLAKLVKLPNVTGYLVAGLLLGPSFLNIIPGDMVDNFKLISDISLAFIAFSIGSEFNLNYFRKVGIAPVIIAICESFGAIILVTTTLIVLGFDVKLSIMLGAIAAATAPAQTIMVINQYKAKGPLTSMLMSVVALDDAVALIGFGFAVTIVNMMEGSSANLVLSILGPFYEIIISFVLGGAMAIVMKLILRYFKKHSNRLCIIAATVLGTYWISTLLHGSELLSCMALGAVLVNIASDEIGSVMKVTEAFTPPIFMIFFVISGAGFEVSALAGIGIIGLLYVVMRIIGKWFGAWTGGKIARQQSAICKYMGPTLMPQAGVALGLIVVASQVVPDYATQIRVVILCSTFIYSIIGPVAAKLALERSGDIKLPAKAKRKHA